jgi:hypothetical protein
MSTDRDTTRIVRSWLEEGRTSLPDRVLDTVLDQLPATPQRRADWPARRFSDMNATARWLTAAAAVVAIAVIGILALPRSSSGPATTPGPSRSPAPSAGSSPISQAGEGKLEAGTYVARPFVPPISGLRVNFTVPGGYTFVPNWAIIPETSEEGEFAGIALLQPNGLFSNPCHWDVDKDGVLEAGDIPTGTTVDDLVNALKAQRSYTVTVVGDVSLGGYSGKRVDLQLPTALDFGTCDKPINYPSPVYFVWGPPRSGAADLFSQGPGNRWQVNILDVEGNRIVVVYQDFASTPYDRYTDMHGILDSIRIEP